MLRRRILLLLAAVCGAAVVVLPAVAGSETSPIVEAVNKHGGGSYESETHAWSPAQVTVSAGGAVTFVNNSSTVAHGVVFSAGPSSPACEAGVPLNTGATSWKGSCTFSQAGTYTFHCYVHPTEMKGSITVGASGTTITTQPPTTNTTTTTTSPSGATTTTAPESTGSAGSGASPLAGSASRALKLGSSQHGRSVRGVLEISRAGAGGRLEVDLLVRSASLASVGHRIQLRVGRVLHVRVGRVVRSSLRAGRVSFAVPLNARARDALRRRGRLALAVRVVVEPTSGRAVTIGRSVVMRP